MAKKKKKLFKVTYYCKARQKETFNFYRSKTFKKVVEHFGWSDDELRKIEIISCGNIR